MIYIVKYNNNTVGVYDSFDNANDFVIGCYQNNLMTQSAEIIGYKLNSCCWFEKNTIPFKNYTHHNHTPVLKSEQKKVTNNTPVLKPEQKQVNTIKKIDLNDSEYLKVNHDRTELNHKINMLETYKAKIEESKSVYNSDLKLYELFTKNSLENPSFIIPEIFNKKYDLFKKLKDNNELSWENFVKEYKHENLYNEHFGLTYYDHIYKEEVNNTENNVMEEFEVDSEIEDSD